MPDVSRLSLYVSDSCGYCAQVNGVARKLGMDIEQRNIADAAHRKALIEATGRSTVPVLRIEGEAPNADGDDPARFVPESLDIIRLLKERAGHKDPVPAWVDRALGSAKLFAPLLAVAGMFTPSPYGSILVGVAVAWIAARILRQVMLT